MNANAKRALAALLLAACASTPASTPTPTPPPAPTPAPTAKAPPAVAPPPAPPPDRWAGRTDLLAVPKTLYDTKVTLGTVEKYKLPNGATVILVPRKSAPVINVTVGFRGGRAAEPSDRAGVAAFMAQMLRKGTTKRTADQISKELESRGATIGVGASSDSLSLRCSARATELELCVSNVADLVLHPVFPDQELGEVRNQLLAAIAARRDSPGAISDMHWRNMLYGEDHPWGRPLSTRSLGTIDRAALVQFHRENLAPNRAVIAITGDFDTKAVRPRLERAFAEWTTYARPVVVPAAKTSGGIEVRLIDKPDATQAAIVMAAPAFSSTSPDFPAVTLMNYAFGGGGFSSRLMQVVRSQGGKTYGIRSRFEISRSGGAVVIATSTRTEEVAATLQLIQKELAKIQNSGITEEELKKAKANLIGGYGLGLETAADVGDALLSAELDGQGVPFVTEWPARLDKVTVEDAARVGKQYLRPVVFTITGNRAAILPQLEKVGLPPPKVLSFTDPVSDRERALDARVAGAGGSSATGPAAELLLAAYKHKGGAAIEKVKYLVLYGSGELQVGGKRVPVKVVERYLAPRSVRVDMTIGNQTLIQVLGEKGGYIENAGRRQPLPEGLLAQMRRALWREPHFVLANALRDGKDLRLDGALLELTAPGDQPIQLRIDPKTRDLLEIHFTEEDKPGLDRLSDYRLIEGGGGLRAPFHAVRQSGAGDLLDITYDKIVLDEKPDPKLFE